jgi:hypothetical protein
MRQFLLLPLAACLLLVPFQRACAQNDAKALIEKAIKAHGGEGPLAKLEKVRVKSKGSLEIMGAGVNFTSEITYQLPNKYKNKMTVDLGGMKVNMTQVLNGNKAWIEGMGMTMDIEGEQLKAIQEEGYANTVEMLVPLLKDKAFTLSTLPEEKVNGKPAVGVRVKSKDHKDIDLFIDKESNLVVRVFREAYDSDTMKEAKFETIYTDFKEFDGVKHGTKVRVNKDGKKYADIEVSDVKTLDKIDPNEFNKSL